jgi:hypothetical protein
MEHYMRALLITLEGIVETKIGEQVEKTIQLITGDYSKKKPGNLDSMYRHIGCQTVTGAGYPNDTHACWADDEGLFDLYDGKQVNRVSWYPEELVGKLLITGFDPETGETTDATMTVEELKSMVMVGMIRIMESDDE